MATVNDAELMSLMEAAQNGGVDPNAVPPSAPVAAPVVGTPEGPGIPPIAPVPASVPSQDATGGFNPDAVSTGAMPAPGAPVVPTPVPLHTAGVDTRAIDLSRQSSADQAQAQANKTPLLSDAANNEADALEKNSQLQRDQAVEVQAEAQAQKDGLAEARRIADEAHEEVKNFKFSDYMGDKSAVGKIVAHIQYALGAFAAAGIYGNGINPAAEKIKMINAQNFQRDKEKLSSKENIAAYKERGVTDLHAQYKDDLAKLQLKQGLALKAQADEAKSFLLRTNVPLQEADNNELVQKLRAEGDKTYAEGFEKLTRDKAMMALERAKLGAQYAQINETRREHDLQHDDKKTAAELAQKNKDDKTVVMDPETGKPLGRVVGGRGGAQAFATRDSDYARGLQQLEAYKKDIEENGDRVIAPSSVKRRLALKHNADIAVATVSPLGKTDEAMKSEAASIGNAGAPGLNADILVGANLDAVNNKIKELKEQRDRYRKSQIVDLDTGVPASASEDKSIPSASRIRSLPESDRKDAIEATQALGGPDDKAARKLLKHLGVM